MANLSRTAIIAALLLVSSPAAADLSDALKAIERRDFATAARELSPLAKAADPEAQYQLGTLYANGDGVPQSYDAAKRLFIAAASQGNSRARQALDFLIGIGVISAPALPEGAVSAATVQAASMPSVTGPAASIPLRDAAPSGPMPAGGFRLQLGTVLNEAGGAAEAHRVARRFQSQLAGVSVAAEQYQMASGDIVYRVLTPVLAEAQAREICDRIRADSGPCLLVNP